MTDEAAVLWEVPRDAGLAWRSWDDDELVVFVEATAGTHLLSAEGGAVMLSLLRLDRPASAGDIADAAWAGLAPREARQRVESVLATLKSIGLASRRES